MNSFIVHVLRIEGLSAPDKKQAGYLRFFKWHTKISMFILEILEKSEAPR